MKRVYIIHRWSGGVEDDWRPWLKTELEKLGYQVFVPTMPDSDTPVIEKWVESLSKLVGKVDKDTFFVGHSIGCQAILRYLQTVTTPVGGAVFVAGWFDLHNLEDDEVTETAKPWIETPIDCGKIKEILPKLTVLLSDNDPYDALEQNKLTFETELNAKVIIVPKTGHFTEDDGFKELPEVLVEFKKL